MFLTETFSIPNMCIALFYYKWDCANCYWNHTYIDRRPCSFSLRNIPLLQIQTPKVPHDEGKSHINIFPLKRPIQRTSHVHNSLERVKAPYTLWELRRNETAVGGESSSTWWMECGRWIHISHLIISIQPTYHLSPIFEGGMKVV